MSHSGEVSCKLIEDSLNYVMKKKNTGKTMNLPKWISDLKKSPFVEKISKTGQTLTKMPSVLNAKQRIASHRWQ